MPKTLGRTRNLTLFADRRMNLADASPISIGRAEFDMPPRGGRLADRDDIIAHHAAGTPPELFVDRMHRHRSDEIGKAFRATLMNLHNDGTIDALEPARTIGASSIDQHQFFTVMHVYCDLIPAFPQPGPSPRSPSWELSPRSFVSLVEMSQGWKARSTSNARGHRA